MDDYTDSTQQKPRYVFAVASAYLGSYAIGAAIGYGSPETLKLHLTGLEFDDKIFGSILTLGALLGGLVAGYPTEKYGRKMAILISTVIFALGWTFMLIKTAAWMLYISRLILGIAIGIDCMAVPVYIGEVSPTERRGVFGSGHQFFCVFGILVTYGFGALWGPIALSITCIVPVVLNALTIVFMPESPTWLVKNNKPNSVVMESLYFLHGRTVRAEAQRELLQEAQQNDVGAFTLGDMFRPAVLRPFLIVLGLMLAQQGCGINAVVFYTTQIFGAAGVSGIDDNVQAIIVGAVNVVFTIPGALLMDKAGRRILLLISSSVTLIGAILLVIFYAIKPTDGPVPGSISWMPLAGLCIYVAGFACGLGPIPWLMMSELLPAKARGTGTGIATAFNWFCAFMVTLSFPAFVSGPGAHYAFAIFGVITFLGILMVLFKVPETKGKSLEEIEALFVPVSELGLDSVDTVESTNVGYKIQ